jgi:AraC-like DNA-binding protein
MTQDTERLAELASLIDRHAPEEGLNYTLLENDVFTYRASHAHDKRPEIYHPAIFILAQGRKMCSVGMQDYDYSAGNYLTTVLPMPMEATAMQASPEEPVLMVGIRVDLHQLASLLLRIDEVEQQAPRPGDNEPSSVLVASLPADLLDSAIRLLEMLDDPIETAILGEAMVEEIYFRVLMDGNIEVLRRMLEQREQIQQVSRAVEHIHQNLDQVVSVDDLAELVNMSTSSFHRAFKEVMHLSPLQYAKSIKLHHAQALIMEGKRVSEAGYMVGYNSPAQFSREYKRQFGYAPSAT